MSEYTCGHCGGPSGQQGHYGKAVLRLPGGAVLDRGEPCQFAGPVEKEDGLWGFFCPPNHQCPGKKGRDD